MNQTPDLYNKMDMVLPTNAVPFQERFNDFVGGVALDCSFVVFTDINACDYYEPEPTPSVTSSPTVTPTNTTTPTLTPTNTTTPTLTPTPTDPRTCRTYEITITGGSGSLYTYVDCNDGLTKNLSIPVFPYPPFNWCAKQNTITYVSGAVVVITDIGTCP
jgi:hypothetical protein